MAKKNRPKRFYDYSLLFCIIFLSVFGLVMIYSASSYTAQLKYNNAGYFMMRQLKIGAGGLVLALIISKLDYHWYAKFSMFAYLLSYVLMIAVTLVGKEVNGKADGVRKDRADHLSGSADYPHGGKCKYLEEYGPGHGLCAPDCRYCSGK